MIPVLVAYLAPITSVIQQIPQLHKVYITKKVKNISFLSLLLLLFSSLLWVIHGYIISDTVLIVGSIMTVLINLVTVVLYVTYV